MNKPPTFPRDVVDLLADGPPTYSLFEFDPSSTTLPIVAVVEAHAKLWAAKRELAEAELSRLIWICAGGVPWYDGSGEVPFEYVDDSNGERCTFEISREALYATKWANWLRPRLTLLEKCPEMVARKAGHDFLNRLRALTEEQERKAEPPRRIGVVVAVGLDPPHNLLSYRPSQEARDGQGHG